MSERKTKIPIEPRSSVPALTVTADMREFGELVAAAQSDQPAKRLGEIVAWHNENDSEHAGDMTQKAKALLAARAILNGYGGTGKFVPLIRKGTGGHSKKPSAHGARATSDP